MRAAGSNATNAASGRRSPSIARKRKSTPSSRRVLIADSTPGVVGLPSEKTTNLRAIPASKASREPNNASASLVEFRAEASAVPAVASSANLRKLLESAVAKRLPNDNSDERSELLSTPEACSISVTALRIASGSTDSETSTR